MIAKEFEDFLLSTDGQAILKDFGYKSVEQLNSFRRHKIGYKLVATMDIYKNIDSIYNNDFCCRNNCILLNG